MQLLSASAMDLDALVSSLNAGTEKERIETIRLLLDAGKLKFNGEKYYL